MLVMQQILAFCVFLVCAGGLYMILQSEGFEQLKLVVLFRFTGLQKSLATLNTLIRSKLHLSRQLIFLKQALKQEL